jgi:hypothetical protein
VTKPESNQNIKKFNIEGQKLTFSAISHAVSSLTRNLEEDRHTTEYQAQSSPEILDHKVLHESMVKAPSQNAVHVLDQREITLIEGILLGLMAMVKGDFFAVINKP